MLKRESVFGLIGSGKFDTCVCTTYAFDFFFFEMTMMRVLNGAGIRNITMLLDGNYYSRIMDDPSFQEHTINNHYALYPIFSKGLFHPKMFMLIGRKEALLVVGSGNVTSSGFGGNDEIWGAFHYSPESLAHSGLFNQGWKYLSRFTAFTNGMAQVKIEWINKHRGWINELPTVPYGSFVDVGKEQSVALLYQTDKLGLYDQVKSQLRGHTVDVITVISPYYDSHGVALNKYLHDYSPKRLNVIVDQNGIIPSSFTPTAACRFYSWDDISKHHEDHCRRLHAKVHHFTCRGGEEYLLFGSANATPEGLGLKSRRHEEAALLVRSRRGGLLKNIGIDFGLYPPKKISDFHASRYIGDGDDDAIGHSAHPIKLEYAEQEEILVTLYLNEAIQSTCVVRIFSRGDALLHSSNLSLSGDCITFKVAFTQGAHSLQLFSPDGRTALSNRVIIHSVLELYKTNPDTRAKEFDILAGQYESGDLSKIGELLRCVLEDEDVTDFDKYIKGSNRLSRQKQAEGPKALKDINTFTIQEQIAHHRQLMLSPTIRMVDLLKYVVKGHHRSDQPDINEGEQITNVDKLQGEYDEVKEDKITLSHLRTERNCIIQYFRRLADSYIEKSQLKDYKVSLSDLAKYVISLTLIEKYLGKVVPEVKEGDRCFLFLSEDGASWSNNLKWLMIGLSGWFLQLITKGVHEYKYESTLKRWSDLKKDALVQTVYFLSCVNWQIHEEEYFRTLALNALIFLGSKTESEKTIRNVVGFLKARRHTELDKKYHVQENISRLIKQVIPSYRRLSKNLFRAVDKRQFVSTTKEGDMLYLSQFGVVNIKDVRPQSGLLNVAFSKPGLPWNNDKEEFETLSLTGSRFLPVDYY